MYQKDTIVFINIFPLGSVFADSIGMESFKKAGYSLVYIDLAKIYYPETYKTWGEGNKKYDIKKDFFIECQTKNEVLHYIKKYANRAWFFPLWIQFSVLFNQRWILRAFKKFQCDYILQDFFPEPIGNKIKDKNLTAHFFNLFITNLGKFGLIEIMKKSVGWISFILLSRNIYYKKPSFCFVAGKIMYNQFMRFYPKSKIVSVPSFDYYKNYFAVTDSQKGNLNGIPKCKYILYYDQSTFDSPDRRILNFPLQLTKETFLKKINLYFERIENITGKKVVIAGSPKRVYEDNEFNGRDIINNLTAKLTYHADIIILHTTMAYNYAVAMNKPFVILKIQEYDDEALNAINNLSKHFRKKIMSIEKNFDTSMLNEATKIDHNIYKNHVYNYMTIYPFTESPAEIMIKTLKKSFPN